MKVPVSPPDFISLLDKDETNLADLVGRGLGPELERVHEHWDHLRHLQPPAGLNPEQWWLALKWARRSLYRELPLRDKAQQPLLVAITDSMARILHFLDREAAGSIRGLDRADDPATRERYLIRSLVEEAMTSSQLEGASTTRQVARQMLASGRQPRDRGERMIWNNFQAMRELARWRERPLTPATIFEMHRVLTADAMDDPSAAGRLRRADEPVEVVDHDGGHVLHRPPPAAELEGRLQVLCDFANGKDESEHFIHPVVRAIALHFQLGYDHPFVDGNGRTARALFYWSMLRSGYWLAEYFSISSALKRAPAQYSRAFLYTETNESDLSYFVSHQLGVIHRAIENLRAYIARKSKERHLAETLLGPRSRLGARLNHRQRELLLNAMRHPHEVYRIAEHQHRQQVSYQTARADLLGLADQGLLRQEKYGAAFVFVPAADLAERLRD